MALPICRLRQIVAVVGERQRREREEHMLLLEWQTRTLASYTAATVPTPKGKKNKLLTQASDIRLVTKGTAAQKKFINAGDPERGTYERFMATMGRGIVQGRS